MLILRSNSHCDSNHSHLIAIQMPISPLLANSSHLIAIKIAVSPVRFKFQLFNCNLNRSVLNCDPNRSHLLATLRIWQQYEICCTEITAAEFAAKFKSKREVYNFLTLDCNAYLCSADCLTSHFLKDLVSGKRKCKSFWILFWHIIVVNCQDVKIVYCP